MPYTERRGRFVWKARLPKKVENDVNLKTRLEFGADSNGTVFARRPTGLHGDILNDSV